MNCLVFLPLCLITTDFLERHANLVDAIWTCGSDCTHAIDGDGFQYVLDGGSLLQRIPWTHGDFVWINSTNVC
jgi:hypothetical protein